jgi:hypothetical protein
MIRQLLVEDTKNDTLGLESHLEGNEIYFTSTNEWLKYPCPMNFSDPKIKSLIVLEELWLSH